MVDEGGELTVEEMARRRSRLNRARKAARVRSGGGQTPGHHAVASGTDSGTEGGVSGARSSHQSGMSSGELLALKWAIVRKLANPASWGSGGYDGPGAAILNHPIGLGMDATADVLRLQTLLGVVEREYALAVESEQSTATQPATIETNPPDQSSGDSTTKRTPNPKARLSRTDREEAVVRHIQEGLKNCDPNDITVESIASATRIPGSTVGKLRSWRTFADWREQQPDLREIKTRQLHEQLLAVLSSRTDDPVDIAAANELSQLIGQQADDGKDDFYPPHSETTGDE